MKSTTLLFLLSFLLFQKANAQVRDTIPFSLEKYFNHQKKDVLKTSITSPLFGNFSFSVEHAIRPRQTLEASFSFIHSNKVTPESLDGFYTGVGYKFFTSPVSSNKDGRTVPILQGFYVQSELLLGFTNKNIFTTTIFTGGTSRNNPIEKQKINYQILLTNIGLQVILLKGIVIDIFAGGGIGRDNVIGEGSFFSPQNSAIYHQGILKANPGFSMAGKVGVRLGILL